MKEKKSVQFFNKILTQADSSCQTVPTNEMNYRSLFIQFVFVAVGEKLNIV